MKKSVKSIVASVLAVMMLLSLAACGNGSENGQSGPASGGKTGGKENTPAFVYVSGFRDLANDNKAVGASCFTENGFYTTSSDVVGRREPAEGEDELYEGQFDLTEENLYFVTWDGERTKLEHYAAPTAEEKEGHDTGCDLFSLAASAEGSLAAIYRIWDSWNDAPEGVTENDDEYWDYSHYEEYWLARTMDATGRELSSARIETSDEEWFWPNGLCYTDGKLLVVGGSEGVRLFNPDGSSAGKISVDGWISSAAILRDGRPVIVCSDNMTGEMRLAAVDVSAGRISETWKCPKNAYNFISGGGDYDLYYQSGINLYGYSLESESSEKLFDWLNVDVILENLSGFTVRSDGSVFGVLNTWDSKRENVTTEFVTVEKKPCSEVPQKESLTLACQWTDNVLQNAVVRFNRTSNIRINVLDYSQYNNENDWNAGRTKLTTEIMSGQMPDILALQGMPYQQLAAKGLLEDLYPYIDEDRDISRDDFLPNVMRALEENGKLYSTFTTFTVSTLAGSARVVGDKPGCSFADLEKALAEMPVGCSILNEYTTSGDILRMELMLDADYYVDWENGKVNFDTQEFIDLLRFCTHFPNYFDWSKYNYEEYQSESQRIAEGKQMLAQMYLGSFDDIIYNEASFGGDMTYIGYPTVSGVGSILNINSGYGMSASCADKEAAWQFLRGFMTEKAMANNEYYYGFPANTKLLEKKLQEAMTVEYQKDAKGNYLLENGERIPVARGGFWIEGADEPIQIYALTQAQADKVMDVIRSADKLSVENTAVLNIVFEQADAFLTGQKSAEEVAKLIQGKLTIYVNEQR